MTDLMEIQEKLQKSGYKLTPQRRSVVSVILNGNGKVLSAEEIFVEVKQGSPEIGLATVYRTLEILANLSILEKVFIADDRIARYSINTGSRGIQIEFICLSCGKWIELPSNLLDDFAERVIESYPYAIKNIHTHIEGLCEDCQKQGENVSNY